MKPGHELKQMSERLKHFAAMKSDYRLLDVQSKFEDFLETLRPLNDQIESKSTEVKEIKEKLEAWEQETKGDGIQPDNTAYQKKREEFVSQIESLLQEVGSLRTQIYEHIDRMKSYGLMTRAVGDGSNREDYRRWVKRELEGTSDPLKALKTPEEYFDFIYHFVERPVYAKGWTTENLLDVIAHTEYLKDSEGDIAPVELVESWMKEHAQDLNALREELLTMHTKAEKLNEVSSIKEYVDAVESLSVEEDNPFEKLSKLSNRLTRTLLIAEKWSNHPVRFMAGEWGKKLVSITYFSIQIALTIYFIFISLSNDLPEWLSPVVMQRIGGALGFQYLMYTSFLVRERLGVKPPTGLVWKLCYYGFTFIPIFFHRFLPKVTGMIFMQWRSHRRMKEILKAFTDEASPRQANPQEESTPSDALTRGFPQVLAEFLWLSRTFEIIPIAQIENGKTQLYIDLSNPEAYANIFSKGQVNHTDSKGSGSKPKN